MTTAHALQTPSAPRNLCSMDAAPILATMPKPAPAKPQAPQQAPVMDLFNGDTSLSGKLTGPTHADRLRQYEGIAPRANVGVSAGGDVNRVHFAAASGHDKKTGMTVELGAVSAAYGDQNELAAVFEQVSVETDPLTDAERRKAFVGLAGKATAEALSAKAHLGIHNADGSVGFNIGASAVLVNAEGTVDVSLLGGVFEGSFTAGVGLAKGGELSVGLRDQDNDGRTEVCGRIGIQPGVSVTLGACLELPKVPRFRF